MEIYQRGKIGWALWAFVLPILVVVNVPARLLARPLRPEQDPWLAVFAGLTVAAAILSLLASRWVFQRALSAYRSASS